MTCKSNLIYCHNTVNRIISNRSSRALWGRERSICVEKDYRALCGIDRNLNFSMGGLINYLKLDRIILSKHRGVSAIKGDTC